MRLLVVVALFAAAVAAAGSRQPVKRVNVQPATALPVVVNTVGLGGCSKFDALGMFCKALK